MKKRIIKIGIISLLSLIGLVLAAGSILIGWVLTPERLTPIVRRQAEKFISCPAGLEKADLTFFKTFPNVGLKINRLSLVNPVEGSNSDTLVYLDECTVGLDIRELIRNNSIVITEFHLNKGYANLFTDSLGKSNYEVFLFETDEDSESEFHIERIDLQKVSMKDMTIDYADISSGIAAHGTDLNLTVKGRMDGEDIRADLNLEADRLLFRLQDSLPLDIEAHEVRAAFNGEVTQFNRIDGNLNVEMENTSFQAGETYYLEPARLGVNAPLAVDANDRKLQLGKTVFFLDEHQLELEGIISLNDNDLETDLALSARSWQISKIISRIPEQWRKEIEKFALDGNVTIEATAQGIYNDSVMPVITAHIEMSNGRMTIPGLPLPVTNMETRLSAGINMDSVSFLTISHLAAQTGQSSLKVSGSIDDLFHRQICDIALQTNLNIHEFRSLVPPELKAEGRVNGTVNARFPAEQLAGMAWGEIDVHGLLNFSDLHAIYNDSLAVGSSSLSVQLDLPSSGKNGSFTEWASAQIEGKNIKVHRTGLAEAETGPLTLRLGFSDLTDTSSLPSVICNFDMAHLNAGIDTISASIERPSGSVVFISSAVGQKDPVVDFSYTNTNLKARMGKEHRVETGNLRVEGKARYDDLQKDLILQWNPELKVRIQNALLHVPELSDQVLVPAMRFNFTPGRFHIRESRIKLGNSDFSLTGVITHLDDFIKKTGLLKGELDFVSENTHVLQLMDMMNGLGIADSTLLAEEVENSEDDPFMVPLGMDITLNTKVRSVFVGNTELQNLHGQLRIKDGILVLEEMGFTSDAAKMQLTAMYRSPRKNHLFAGIDFHLLDIDIERLIAMIPEIDTIVPMLKSFAGKAEFHFAVETYMKSNYDLKLSTLRGAAAIEGRDLVVLDSETFGMIAKKLKFRKKTENKVDSLSVEMTVFRNEVDLYPFLIAMDKYKAVISGRHNLDMSFDYHISITETPLPIRLGLNVYGTLDKLRFKLARCQYARLYKPDKQRAVEKKTLELKKLISDSLKANLKE